VALVHESGSLVVTVLDIIEGKPDKIIVDASVDASVEAHLLDHLIYRLDAFIEPNQGAYT
jgi:diaminopimelate decarboxylase